MKCAEDAAVGDTIELLKPWQDASGIPLACYPAGERLKVLYPDLTTGGVIVGDPDGIVIFSLKPDQYRVVEDEPNES